MLLPIGLTLGTLLGVDLPACRYMTPAAKRGWKRVPSRGEDPEKWYDADGVRNGPPRNYWRQATDERVHTGVVDMVNSLVESKSAALPGITALESKMGISKPLLNQKLMGTWAPVLYRGNVVASLVNTTEPKTISCTITTSKQLIVPATLSVRRMGERRTVTNGYGTKDAHLKPGEAIQITLNGPGAVAESFIGAIQENERQHIRWQSSAGRTRSRATRSGRP